MTETINGLLTQRPERPPEAGQIKCFTVENRVSAAGKPWIKVKNATPDKGGRDYRILNVQPTDFTDAHGNVSFNIELEQVNGQQLQPATSTLPTHQNLVQDPVDACNRHLFRACQAMMLCLDTASSIGEIWESKHKQQLTPDQFQAITSTLFINLDKSGLINQLPSAPIEKEKEF
jgi:hypothetical protein